MPTYARGGVGGGGGGGGLGACLFVGAQGSTCMFFFSASVLFHIRHDFWLGH